MTRIYEINTLPWLSELSEKYSKPISLANIPAGEWDRLEKLGFEYVWLMGLWERSKIGRRIALEMKELHPAYSAALPGWSPDDVAGSTYSIQAYRPDPDIGGWDALARLRNQLGRRGMGLILDLVCNHTGIDFPWVQKTPERYMQGNAEDHERDPSRFVPLTSRGRTLYLAKGRDPLFAPWQDTAQLNVFNPSTRRALGRLVTDIAKRCDGLRCDMAMLLLTGIFSQTWRGLLADPPPATEFWGDLIATHRRLLWIGEAYWDTEWTLQQLGFDFVYDKRLYDRLRNGGAEDVRAHLGADVSFQEKLLRFVENHDEERSAAVFEPRRLQAANVITATVPGMTLYHHGQLEGRRNQVPLQLRRSAAEPVDEQLASFYEKLLRITREATFFSGDWELLESRSAGDDTYHNLIAYRQRRSSRAKVVVVNFSGQWGQARIPLDLGAGPGTLWLTDELTQEKYGRDSGELRDPGLHVLLDAFQSHIFDIRL